VVRRAVVGRARNQDDRAGNRLHLLGHDGVIALVVPNVEARHVLLLLIELVGHGFHGDARIVPGAVAVQIPFEKNHRAIFLAHYGQEGHGLPHRDRGILAHGDLGHIPLHGDVHAVLLAAVHLADGVNACGPG